MSFRQMKPEKNAWIQSVSKENYVLMKPHYKRGTESMDEIGIRK
jgi:hypothetical protein